MLFYTTPVLHKTRFKSNTHVPLLHNFIPVTLYSLHSKSVCSSYSILGSLYLVFISYRKRNLRWGHILSMLQPYRTNMKWTWSYVIIWNANLMQQGNFIDVFLARHVSGTQARHQEHWMCELQHMVFCTEFLDGWWSWELLYSSCVRCAPHTRPIQEFLAGYNS